LDLHELKQPVYIVPFSVRGIFFYHLLRQNRIPVAGFLDNKAEMRGLRYDGCEIFSPMEIRTEISRATIVVCTANHANVLYQQFRELGAQAIIDLNEITADVNPAELADRVVLPDLAAIAPMRVPYMREIIKICKLMNGWDVKGWQYILTVISELEGRPYAFIPQPIKPAAQFPGLKTLLCVNGTAKLKGAYFEGCLRSIAAQTNAAFDTVFFFCEENRSQAERLLQGYQMGGGKHTVTTVRPNADVFTFLKEAAPYAGGYDLLIVMHAHDELAANAILNLVEAASDHPEYPLITAYEDRLYKDCHIAPYYKDDYIEDEYVTLQGLLRQFFAIRAEALGRLHSLKKTAVRIVKEVLYHYRVDEAAKQDNGIKPIAFYLPQFHPIPENDRWWGKGFTEWVNVKRAYPMFTGHYQPHEPGELGYYDLVADPEVQHRQIALAKKYGIYGFCYYYYWFNGKRLLEKPLNRVLQDPSLDLPFCICWANETWSRRWDGSEHEVLIQQVHNSDSDRRFILDVIPILKDPRYIRINGAPLLLIYRTDLFEDFPSTVQMWREICAEHGLPQIHVSMVQSFNAYNPVSRGCDSATAFPPHNSKCRNITPEVEGLDPEFQGFIFDYREFVAREMNRRKTPFLNFRGAMLSWDNTARRLKRATIFKNADPEEYKKLLLALADYTCRMPREERFIFINAWNEWAEGTHLEPDKKYGDAYLQATYDAIRINC